MAQKQKVVILGAGFAGIYTARALLRKAGDSLDITIVNRTNYFLFTPMLHEVATGALGHHQVVESIREIMYKTPASFIEGDITNVDLTAKQVVTTGGTVAYDMLIIALGATTNFFGTKGAEEHSFVLKNLADAITLRDHVIDRFESASRAGSLEEQKKLLSFVVVGGGATGVEYASELATLCAKTLRKYYRKEIPCDAVSITLVQSGQALLPPFSPKTRARALKSLTKNGVRVLLNTKVAEVTAESVILSSGEILPADMVVWSAGVKANTLPVSNGTLPLDPTGRIMTRDTFVVEGYDDVYALGDVASVANASGKGYPMLAQTAVLEAGVLSDNIARRLAGKPLRSFAFRARGELVSLGQWEAAGTIFGIDIHGKLAWFVWRTVYLFKFISKSKKIKIAMDWTIQLFFPRDITRS